MLNVPHITMAVCLLFPHSDLYDFYHYFYMLTNVLFYVSSAINPILYNLVSATYRQIFFSTLRFFCMPCRHTPRRHPHPLTRPLHPPLPLPISRLTLPPLLYSAIPPSSSSFPYPHCPPPPPFPRKPSDFRLIKEG